MWCLIVLIPDFCPLSYFKSIKQVTKVFEHVVEGLIMQSVWIDEMQLCFTGLENSTRPLVFTSASGCRASENFDISNEK